MADGAALQSPGIGHNKPPEPVDANLVTSDPAVLRAQLERRYPEQMARVAEFGLGFAKVPTKITTEAEAEKAVTWGGKQVKDLMGELDRAHTKEKAPYLHTGNVVDRFFNDPIRILKDIVGLTEKRLQQYHDLKKAEIRRREAAEKRQAELVRQRAEAEAARAAEEARTKEAAGDRPGAVAATRRAEQAKTDAMLAEAIIERPPASTAIRGEYGSIGFSVPKWDYEEIDPAAVPRGCLMIDDKVMRELIAAGARDHDIPGIRIYPNDRFTTRKC
jgi:hypothetical protein